MTLLLLTFLFHPLSSPSLPSLPLLSCPSPPCPFPASPSPHLPLPLQVTCRAVGIGAYLVRLSQRVVQVDNSNIILTGASTLNKVLGREVRSVCMHVGCMYVWGWVCVLNGVGVCEVHTASKSLLFTISHPLLIIVLQYFLLSPVLPPFPPLPLPLPSLPSLPSLLSPPPPTRHVRTARYSNTVP